MGNIALDNRLLATIASLAKQLKTTKEEIIKNAIASYAEKAQKKNQLMSFAGILDEDEADDMLDAIYQNRKNKDTEIQL